MGRYHATDDYEDDPNEPEESDMDGDEGNEFVETIACPHCGKAVYEQAERCSGCGVYLSGEDSPRTNHPRWVIATALMLLAVILYGWIRWSL